MAAERSLLVLWLLAGAAAALVALLLWPFAQPIFFAFVLAMAFEPLHARLSRRFHSPSLVAALCTLTIAFAVVVPLTALGIIIARQAADAYQHLVGESAQQGGWSSWLAQIVNQPIDWISARTGMTAPDIRAALLARAQSVSALLIGWGGSLLSNLTSVIGNGLLSLFVVFFLFQQGRAINKAIYRWLPLDRARVDELLKSISDAVAANVYGIAAVGSVQGLLTGLGFLFTGLSSPVLWGAVAAFCSLIPVVGTALVWVPGALILLAQGAWGKALFLALWGTFVVGMSDNFVRPWALAGRTEMNTLVVFFALMGGMQVFGFIGLFAGPVVFSVAIVLARMLREELDARRA